MNILKIKNNKIIKKLKPKGKVLKKYYYNQYLKKYLSNN